MKHDDSTLDELPARIDLQTWRVPAPPLLDRASLVSRALTPRSRRPSTTTTAVVAAIGGALATVVVFLAFGRGPAPTPASPVAAPVDDSALKRLEREQRELEAKLGDIQLLQKAVRELSGRVDRCEQATPGTRVPPPQRPSLPSSPRTSALALPDTLDRDSIMAGIAPVRAKIDSSCGALSAAPGTIVVRVRVAPRGHVESVLVDKTTDTRAACVADAMQRASFSPTHHGGSFNYPFVFGSAP